MCVDDLRLCGSCAEDDSGKPEEEGDDEDVANAPPDEGRTGCGRLLILLYLRFFVSRSGTQTVFLRERPWVIVGFYTSVKGGLVVCLLGHGSKEGGRQRVSDRH